MQLKPFLLDMWLDTYEHNIEFHLAASTGPRWTLNEILNLAGEDCRLSQRSTAVPADISWLDANCMSAKRAASEPCCVTRAYRTPDAGKILGYRHCGRDEARRG